MIDELPPGNLANYLFALILHNLNTNELPGGILSSCILKQSPCIVHIYYPAGCIQPSYLLSDALPQVGGSDYYFKHSSFIAWWRVKFAILKKVCVHPLELEEWINYLESIGTHFVCHFSLQL